MSKHIQKLGLYSKQLDVALNALDRASRHLRIPPDLKADIIRALQDVRYLETTHDAISKGASKRAQQTA